ncbi:MAG: excinuclease ABC subunit UvrA, partial [Bacteroidales bacterium]
IRTGPRSTVATMTGVYDLYRLLYSRIGTGPSSNGNPWSSLFSFNHQDGACPQCDGLGKIAVCDPDKLVSEPQKPLIAGAMDGHKSGKFYGDPFGQYVHTLLAAGEKHGMDFNRPWLELNERGRMVAMYGTGDEMYDVTWKFKRGKREGEHHFKGKWQGFARLVEEEYARKHADRRGESMRVLMKENNCPSCRGARLNPQAVSYTVAGKNIAELAAMSVTETMTFFAEFENKVIDADKIEISLQLRRDILKKLDVLNRLGLGYLQSDRISSELSGGEAQRVRLAAQLGNGLTGLTYVLDEPTVGLHPADTGKLMGIIRELRNAGNTVVIVEHDREVILGADHLIELGPGAGEAGGNLIASGKPADLADNPESVTGKYLKQKHLFSDIKQEGQRAKKDRPSIKIFSANAHNLQDIDVKIPAGKMVAVTGVSGSGKSTLVFDVLAASWRAGKPVGCSAVEGWEGVSDLIAVTQEKISASTVSNAATFTGIFDRIRDLFAKTPGAVARGLKKNHFSFNIKGGRCEKCEGQGQLKISLDFVSDVWVTCDECYGRRYQVKVLDCKLEGRNIYEVLEMSIRQAADFFAMDNYVQDRLAMLSQVGLGYVKLGQSTGTMSGGELQRLKLARELMKSGTGKNLYLFDEPSTGLHFRDVELLLTLFRQLVDQGHSLVIIEHDPDIIRYSDWVIDLGPGGGIHGGTIVAEGTPDEIARHAQSLTGRCLSGTVS